MGGHQGSSPHTRGAPADDFVVVQENGIIPAYAGSTLDPDRSGVGDWDHPRIRGEHYAAHKVALEAGGSSPHTRGARPPCRRRPSSRRIIPAYAGSTGPQSDTKERHQDHPRIRGEHFQFSFRLSLGAGSSPHTRGALLVVVVTLPGCGIIPAYAGSTSRAPTRTSTLTDHPRIRGEHSRR